MDFILAPLIAFTQHVDIVHVLALNLSGWVLKGCMKHHPRLQNWTDMIPLALSGLGVFFAVVDPGEFVRHPVIQGLAEAGLAWVLHQGVKKTPTAMKAYAEEKTSAITQKIKTIGKSHG